jgi:hypothetical protein
MVRAALGHLLSYASEKHPTLVSTAFGADDENS